jgi:hypothetical protein
MKIKLHSITDLITNSSTVIYTYSDASEGALREMIDETFKILGVDKKCDDVFTLTITLDDEYHYSEAFDDGEVEVPDELQGLTGKALTAAIDEVVEKVKNGEMEKPQWMKSVEGKNDYNYYAPGTTLNITPKAPEFAKLAELIGKFLYSTTSESCYNG